MAKLYAMANGNISNGTSVWKINGAGGFVTGGPTDTYYANSFTVTIDQDWVAGGLLNTSDGGSATAGGKFQISNGVTMTVNGNLSVQGADLFVNNGTVSATLNVTGTITGAVTTGAGCGINWSSSGTLTMTSGNVNGGTSGAATTSCGIKNSGTGIINNTSSFTLTGGSLGIGALNSSTGQLNLGSTSNKVTINPGSASSVYGLSLTGAGASTIYADVNGNASAAGIQISAGTLTIGDATHGSYTTTGSSNAAILCSGTTATLTFYTAIVGGSTGVGLSIAGALTNTVNIVGNVTGGSGSGGNGIGVTAAITLMNITGTVQGGTNLAAYGLNVTANATITIVGAVVGGLTSAGGHGVNNTASAAVIKADTFRQGTSGSWPCGGVVYATSLSAATMTVYDSTLTSQLLTASGNVYVPIIRSRFYFPPAKTIVRQRQQVMPPRTVIVPLSRTRTIVRTDRWFGRTQRPIPVSQITYVPLPRTRVSVQTVRHTVRQSRFVAATQVGRNIILQSPRLVR